MAGEPRKPLAKPVVTWGRAGKGGSGFSQEWAAVEPSSSFQRWNVPKLVISHLGNRQEPKDAPSEGMTERAEPGGISPAQDSHGTVAGCVPEPSSPADVL